MGPHRKFVEVHNGFTFATPCNISSISVSTCVSQERFALKSCWESINKPWSSMYCMIDLAMMYSHTLQQMDVNDTGLSIVALFLSPFLKMDATRVVFYWWRILPVSRYVVNMEVRWGLWGATSSANSFNTFGEILSGPLDLFVLSPFSSFW